MALSTGELIFVLFPAPFSIRSVAGAIGHETTRRSRRVSGSVALMHGRMAENRPGAPPLWRVEVSSSSHIYRECTGGFGASLKPEALTLGALVLSARWRVMEIERVLRFTWGHDSHGCNRV